MSATRSRSWKETSSSQHYVTRAGATSMVGNVFLGRVQNVLPGMEAAFVDVGRGRNGVLYAGEVNYSPEDIDGPAPRIEQLLKAGQAVMVQVTKDPMGGKGARLTAKISLAGPLHRARAEPEPSRASVAVWATTRASASSRCSSGSSRPSTA